MQNKTEQKLSETNGTKIKPTHTKTILAEVPTATAVRISGTDATTDSTTNAKIDSTINAKIDSTINAKIDSTITSATIDSTTTDETSEKRISRTTLPKTASPKGGTIINLEKTEVSEIGGIRIREILEGGIKIEGEFYVLKKVFLCTNCI